MTDVELVPLTDDDMDAFITENRKHSVSVRRRNSASVTTISTMKGR